MDVPTKVCDLRRFLGLVNYYRDMSHKRAHTLAPLTKLCDTKPKFECANSEEKVFMDMKKISGRDVFLSYPNFSEEFIIHTYVRKMKLGGVISKKSEYH